MLMKEYPKRTTKAFDSTTRIMRPNQEQMERLEQLIDRTMRPGKRNQRRPETGMKTVGERESRDGDEAAGPKLFEVPQSVSII